MVLCLQNKGNAVYKHMLSKPVTEHFPEAQFVYLDPIRQVAALLLDQETHQYRSAGRHCYERDMPRHGIP